MLTNISKELLFHYFAGSATAFQKTLIEEWAKEPKNRELFFECLAMWESQNPQYLADVSQALVRHQHKRATKAAENEKTITMLVSELPNRWHWLRWMIAASVLVMITISGWIFKDNLMYETHQTTYGETRSLQLSDGSTVTLNTNSSLSVPRFGFGNRTREVLLKGEAEFKVKHKANHQKFIVKTDNLLDIVVLGTEFTVYARKRGAKVVLNQGKIQLRYQEGKTNKQIMMKPGDFLTFDGQNHLKKEVTQKPEKLAAWKDHRFVFEETTLQEVAYLLEENYGLQVNIEGKELSERVIMGSFRAENVDELLQSISELLDINVVRQGNQVQLMDK